MLQNSLNFSRNLSILKNIKISPIDPSSYIYLPTSNANVSGVPTTGGYGTFVSVVVHPDSDKMICVDYNRDYYHLDGITANDLSTFAYQSAKSRLVGGNGTTDFVYNPNDLTKIVRVRSNTTLEEVTIGAGFDFSSFTTGGTFDGSGVESVAVSSLSWNKDGTKLLIGGFGSQKIHVLECPTPYSLASASINAAMELSLGFTPYGVHITEDGSQIVVLD